MANVTRIGGFSLMWQLLILFLRRLRSPADRLTLFRLLSQGGAEKKVAPASPAGDDRLRVGPNRCGLILCHPGQLQAFTRPRSSVEIQLVFQAVEAQLADWLRDGLQHLCRLMMEDWRCHFEGETVSLQTTAVLQFKVLSEPARGGRWSPRILYRIRTSTGTSR